MVILVRTGRPRLPRLSMVLKKIIAEILMEGIQFGATLQAQMKDGDIVIPLSMSPFSS